MQARLMDWCMNELHHDLIAPNITNVYWWECDLLSMTKAKFVHEFEIKRSISDYRAEFKNKQGKHHSLRESRTYNNGVARTPNYFWYVTADFDIDPPDYAGWIKFMDLGEEKTDFWIKKDAPRLHNQKINDKKIISIARVISFRLREFYWSEYKDFKLKRSGK